MLWMEHCGLGGGREVASHAMDGTLWGWWCDNHHPPPLPPPPLCWSARGPTTTKGPAKEIGVQGLRQACGWGWWVASPPLTLSRNGNGPDDSTV
jgi:hypothetical protein